MIIYPAVDIKNGKAVRLVQGKASDLTVYNENPVDAAMQWKSCGASWLHVVDLDGAFSGQGENLPIIEKIVSQTGLNIQTGGGIRSLNQIKKRMDAGVKRVIIGTAALADDGLIEKAISEYGEDAIACGIDAKGGYVAVKGWVELTELTPVQLALRVSALGVRHIIYTDISKDGMLCGPNFDSTAELIKATGLEVIASGGISSMRDLIQCAKIGAAGAICGKAIYTGAIDLAAAIAYFEGD